MNLITIMLCYYRPLSYATLYYDEAKLGVFIKLYMYNPLKNCDVYSSTWISVGRV